MIKAISMSSSLFYFIEATIIYIPPFFHFSFSIFKSQFFGKIPRTKKQSIEINLPNQNTNNNTGPFTIGNFTPDFYGWILMWP